MVEVTRSASVVAWYAGVDVPALAGLAHQVQSRLAAGLGAAFTPRPIDTLHTTLIGLEPVGPVTGGPGTLLDSPTVDVRGLCAHLLERLTADPLLVQFGGFADDDQPVTSRGQRLFDRSLVVDGDKVVLVGWPVVDGEPTWRLDTLRRELVTFGTEHRYPLEDGARDPDAHMVVGTLTAALPTPQLDSALAGGRRDLAASPVQLPVRPGDVSIVAYDDPRLPRASTLVLRLVGSQPSD